MGAEGGEGEWASGGVLLANNKYDKRKSFSVFS